MGNERFQSAIIFFSILLCGDGDAPKMHSTAIVELLLQQLHAVVSDSVLPACILITDA
jgi:hypothetical protein